MAEQTTPYKIFALTVALDPPPWSESQWAICQRLLAPFLDHAELGGHLFRVEATGDELKLGRLSCRDASRWTRTAAKFYTARFDLPSLTRCERAGVLPGASLRLISQSAWVGSDAAGVSFAKYAHATLTFAIALTHPLLRDAETAVRQLANEWHAKALARKTREWWQTATDHDPHHERSRPDGTFPESWESIMST